MYWRNRPWSSDRSVRRRLQVLSASPDEETDNEDNYYYPKLDNKNYIQPSYMTFYRLFVVYKAELSQIPGLMNHCPLLPDGIPRILLHGCDDANMLVYKLEELDEKTCTATYRCAISERKRKDPDSDSSFLERSFKWKYLSESLNPHTTWRVKDLMLNWVDPHKVDELLQPKNEPILKSIYNTMMGYDEEVG